MTVQQPERLINDHPRVRFVIADQPLQLYGVIRGDPHANNGWGKPYRFQHQPDLSRVRAHFTSIWRGYVSTFRLHPEGFATLDQLAYVTGIQSRDCESVDERLTGDFYFVMKPAFKRPRIYVPFQSGEIVEDSAHWVRERRD